MATQINIFNHEWCELVFVHRNQSYGAFVIRQNAAKRHLLAIMITLTIFILGISLPAIFHKDKVIQSGVINGEVTLTKLPPVKDTKTEIIPQVIEQFPKNFRPTIAFVPPVIVDDLNIDQTDTIPTMDDLNKSKADISVITIKGDPESKEKFTPDILPPTVDNTIHTYVGQMPQFPGGDGELFKYLKENMKYPQVPLENGISGTVFVQFVVFASGEVGNVKVARGFDESCEKEAIRVIKNMNKWIPGKQNGNPVNVQMSVPVHFKLQVQE